MNGGGEVQDYSGLAYLTKLKELDLMRSDISDLSPLADMACLQELDIFDCPVTDLSPLSELTALERLRAGSYEGRATDLSPLTKLTKLKSIHMSFHGVKDISPLAGMMELEYINMDRNEIEDISALAGKNHLNYISLDGNRIRDIKVLFSLPNVEHIDIDDNPIDEKQMDRFYNETIPWQHVEEKALAEGEPLLRFTLTGNAAQLGSYKIATSLRVEEAESGALIQEIGMEMLVRDDYTPFLSWEDTNFDGYEDFGMLDQEMTSAYYADLSYWRWNPQKRRFDAAEELNVLHYVSFNPVRKEVHSGDKEGWFWRMDQVHRYIEGDLVPMERTEWTISNSMDYDTALGYADVVKDCPRYDSYYYREIQLFQQRDGEMERVSCVYELYGERSLEEQDDQLGLFDIST